MILRLLGKKKRNMGSSSSKKKSSSGGYYITGDIDEDDGLKVLKEEAGGLKVDKNSITALGYGPISASKLNSLITSGEVIEYEVNGVLKYKKASKQIIKKDSKKIKTY